MTVKGLHANNKPSLFETAFSNGSSNSSSPSRDVNLNHLKIVNPAQRSPSHNQGFSPSSSPTREVPESPTQKSSIKEDRYVIEATTETSKNDEFLLKSPEKMTLKDVSFERRKSREVSKQNSSQTRENDNKEEVTNGRTAINIPGDLPSPKAKSPPVVVEKRNSLRNSELQQQQQASPQKEHREHHRDHHHNGAKVSNHHNNNKTNSACLNNLILPLLSDVSRKKNEIDEILKEI